MELKIYAVYDSKIKAYSKPFYALSRGQAMRGWIDQCNDSSSEIYKHSEDYGLFELGVFDDSNGQFENEKTPYSLGLAQEFKKEKN